MTSTTPARLRSVALLGVGALLAACTGTGTGSATDRHTTFELDGVSGSDADRLLAVGDFEAAASRYEDALADDPDSPVLQEKLATARHSAAQLRAGLALEAASRGLADDARRHLAAAEHYAPDAPVVRRTRAQLDDALRNATRATDLVRQAELLMESEPGAAQDLLAEARRMDARNPRIVELLREATLRAEAARAAARADVAWSEGRRADALRELEAARYAGRPVGHALAIRARIEGDLLRDTLDADIETLRRARDIAIQAPLSSSTVRTIRDRLVAALTIESQRLQEAGRPAVAALLETECLRLGARLETPALDAVVERAQVRIAIEAFEDGTGGDVDGLRLAQGLAARLVADARGGGAALGVIEPGPDQARLIAAYPRALRLGGKALEARVAEGPRNASVRNVPVPVSSRLETNPDALHAEAQLRQAEARLGAMRELLADARRELDGLESLPFSRGPDGRRISQGRASFEMEISRAEARVANLQRRESDLAAQELAARERLLATPRQREVPVYGSRPMEVYEFRKVAKVTVHLRMTRGDETLLDTDVTGSALHDEVVAAAFAEAGIPEDPDDTPDDAAMARDAAAHFAVVAAGRIREAAEQAARAFLLDARAAERAGDTAAAAEGYALYLLSTAEVASPHRADAARALHELAGVRVALRTGAEEEQR